ncbi:ketopantoate reductase family protein [Candidatus Foliamicus sp.]
MRFAIIGVGGVGGSLGSALLRAGHDVLFVARDATARVLKQRGLAVRHAPALPTAGRQGDPASPDSASRPAASNSDCLFQREINVVSESAGQPPAEAALLCVKRYDLVDAIETHSAWLASCGSVVTLQNGLDAPQAAARLLPAGKVVGATVQVVAKLLEPGVILREGDTLHVNLAEPAGEITPRLTRLHEALAASDITAEVHRHLETMLWLKFLMVACSSSINVALRSGFDAMASNPAMPWLLEIALQEALAVARAHAIRLPDDIEAQTRTTLKNVFASGGKASLLTDLERGNPLELEWLSGAIHRMGKQTGVPTPLHTAIHRELLPLAAGQPSRRPQPSA